MERSRYKGAPTNLFSNNGEEGGSTDHPIWDTTARAEYDRRMVEIHHNFDVDGDGLSAVAARTVLVNELVMRFWNEEVRASPKLTKGIAVTAIGGFGRGHLFPYSDVDMLLCVEKSAERQAKDSIRRLSQSLWDCGLQVSLITRPPCECERLDAQNPEFGLALLDLRRICGDEDVFAKLRYKAVATMQSRDAKAMGIALARLTRERHAKYGDTLFHLEPNIKDCAGGLRDANVCNWLHQLRMQHGVPGTRRGTEGTESNDFRGAFAFLVAVRCFLHYRHGRDDNTLDWESQDALAKRRIGITDAPRSNVDAAHWMRVYFRHARVVERCLFRESESTAVQVETRSAVRPVRMSEQAGFRVRNGVLDLKATTASGTNAAHEPEIVLAAFATVARTGARLSRSSEERIADAIPMLSAYLEEGPGLWRQISDILTGSRAGHALRAMHALGVLELILPEFRGIDALVIRDAYHRYTVDEHTFVLIDTLHALEAVPEHGVADWRANLSSMIRELQNPGLLYLAALLHDTGKGSASEHHVAESVRMAQSVLERLELDTYDSGLVIRLIETHLEMSTALRRDIFNAETVRVFVGKVQTHESLRMLTLFTYADIAAVHPDALTPWKAESLWRLSVAAANQLDRNVDEERIHARVVDGFVSGRWRKDEKIGRMISFFPGRQAAVEQFLEGFPERYVSTRSPETMREHFEMTQHFMEDPFQVSFQQGSSQSGATMNEITLVSRDRPRLFAGIASALAAWGMNVVTADAFANEAGVVVDTFRFTDTFRTLELNESEREKFVTSVRDLAAGRTSIDKLLRGRRRVKRKPPRVTVETKIEFDGTASSHSTLLQVVAQDIPGLLRTISATISKLDYNVEVALIDTEGDAAIDVFYLTSNGDQLTEEQQRTLRDALLLAIEENSC